MFGLSLITRKTNKIKWQTTTQSSNRQAFFKENFGWLCVRMSFLSILPFLSLPAEAGSFRVQCPEKTSLHPIPGPSAPYTKPVPSDFVFTPDSVVSPAPTKTLSSYDNGGAVKCQQVSGGDGFATMADGTQTYLFSFGPLSGLADIYAGLPGTQLASTFNQYDPGLGIGEPNKTTTFNGAVGLSPDPITGTNTGHIDARTVMDVGVLNGSHPAPTIAIDEDDELFLTLTNVGMIMRPDLFEQHTIHFHGYPNASSFYDGVPDASAAINIGGSFTYYYLAPDAGTYFWHCHITPPEHLQMGMEGNLYVRPRQNRVRNGNSLFASLKNQQIDPRLKCSGDILCTTPVPPTDNGFTQGPTKGVKNTRGYTTYAYNDGDGSTAYDVEYPIQIMGFDPNFHFVGMTFNPESFTDIKDKYFLLNGRSYPDTINPDAMTTQSTDGTDHASQPVRTIINIPEGGKALLRLAMLGVSEYQTLASLGIPMTVIANNARLLRDLDGNNLYYTTNSITMGGGESMDVILDASDTGVYTAGQKFYLYTPQLDHLSNDAENFGGLMTEVNICNKVNPITKACTLI